MVARAADGVGIVPKLNYLAALQADIAEKWARIDAGGVPRGG